MGRRATVDLDTYFASDCSAFGLAVNVTALEFWRWLRKCCVGTDDWIATSPFSTLLLTTTTFYSHAPFHDRGSSDTTVTIDAFDTFLLTNRNILLRINVELQQCHINVPSSRSLCQYNRCPRWPIYQPPSPCMTVLNGIHQAPPPPFKVAIAFLSTTHSFPTVNATSSKRHLSQQVPTWPGPFTACRQFNTRQLRNSNPRSPPQAQAPTPRAQHVLLRPMGARPGHPEEVDLLNSLRQKVSFHFCVQRHARCLL